MVDTKHIINFEDNVNIFNIVLHVNVPMTLQTKNGRLKRQGRWSIKSLTIALIQTNDTPLMTNNKYVLYINYKDLQTFEWKDVVNKRIQRESTLANILFAVMCRNKATKDNLPEILLLRGDL